MEYLLSEIIKDPNACPIMHESGYLVYRIHKVGSDWDRDNYIGDTKDSLMNRMFNGFFGHLNPNAKHSPEKIRNAIKKYGTDQFTLEIIYKGDYIDWIEEMFITMHDSFENGYNQNRSGKGTGGSTSEMVRKIWESIPPEERSSRCRKSNIKALENGTHPFQVEGHQSEAGRHSHDNMTHEQNVDIGIRSSATRLANDPERLTYKRAWITSSESNGGEHPTKKWRREFKESDPEGYKEYVHSTMLKSAKRRVQNGTMKEKWVFYNPRIESYIIHSSNWVQRFKKGYSEKLCKLSDWEDYCEKNSIDKHLLPDQ